MALSQADRIILSKIVTSIPRKDAAADQIIEILESGKQKALDEDNANKNLMDAETVFVNPYQKELSSYDAGERSELVEQDLINGAEKKFQNFFFANDPQTALPSTPSGIWLNFPPSGYSKAIGKNYVEVFPPTVIKEQDKIDTLNTAISAVEAMLDPVRSSGQECAAGTPSDTYSPNAAAISALSDLQTAIDDWKAFVNSTKILIQDENTADPDGGRQAQNNTAIADIDNLISIIDTWDSLQDFDITTSLPGGVSGSGCIAFDALTFAYFNPSKLRSPELQFIKDEITARQSFISARIPEIEANLGSVTQDANGRISAADGFYGDRFRVIDLRLNLMSGSLNKVKAADAGINAQNELKASNANAIIVYSSVIKVSLFRAPASGSEVIHLKDASDFNPGDNVFVIADSQEEIATSIISKNGNAVTLANSIPKKYR